MGADDSEPSRGSGESKKMGVKDWAVVEGEGGTNLLRQEGERENEHAERRNSCERISY